MQETQDYQEADYFEAWLENRKASSNLLDFTLFTKKGYQVNWHHRLICDRLDKFVSGEIRRLIICMPPRNGKSEAASRRLPAYILGRNPDCQIIACSYSADLSSRMNRDVQRIIDSPSYQALFPETRLNYSNVRSTAQGSWLRNSDVFEIVGHDGVYRSSGVGGGITGMGMDFGIIDDYCKNREEAESRTIRNKIYEWYTDVFATREEGAGSILITATRWHADDLIGRLLEKAKDPEADQWEVINLPALSEEDRPEYDERDGPNQPLWPGKFSREWLLKKKSNVPFYTWLSLYQQRPSAAEGNIFKDEHIQYCKYVAGSFDLGDRMFLKDDCIIIQTCDPAASKRTTADYFALCTWAITPDSDLILLDVFRKRLTGPEQLKLFRVQYNKWKPACQYVEKAGLGITLYQFLENEGLPIKPLLPGSADKVTRALPAATRMASGRVFLVDEARGTWGHDFIEELLTFPNGEHDDMVDNFSYAAAIVAGGRHIKKAVSYSQLSRKKPKFYG